MVRTKYMDPAALPPIPDPETGLPRPPRAPAPGRVSDKPQKPDHDRVNDPTRAPLPPAGQGPVLAWYRSSLRGALVTGLWGTGLVVLVVSARDRFQFHWVHFWEFWLVFLGIGFAIGLAQLRGRRCSAGAEWVSGRKSWVRTYQLVKVKNSRSPWGVHVRMWDSGGRDLRISLAALQQDRLLWDLVYNGILHSVIASNAETDGATHLYLRLPYRSPYGG